MELAQLSLKGIGNYNSLKGDGREPIFYQLYRNSENGGVNLIEVNKTTRDNIPFPAFESFLASSIREYLTEGKVGSTG